jgi:hypothetical protein
MQNLRFGISILVMSARCWPKIVSHFHATGVRCGHISASGKWNLGVRFGEIAADVAAAKSEVL